MTKEALMFNPLTRAEHEVADLLRQDSWMKEHKVEIIEQNEASFRTLLQKTMAQTRGTVIIVGVDEFENDPPALEATISIECLENVMSNRIRADYASALDAAQRALFVVDGQWWQNKSFTHKQIESGILQAYMTFKGLVDRETTDDYEP